MGNYDAKKPFQRRHLQSIAAALSRLDIPARHKKRVVNIVADELEPLTNNFKREVFLEACVARGAS